MVSHSSYKLSFYFHNYWLHKSIYRNLLCFEIFSQVTVRVYNFFYYFIQFQLLAALLTVKWQHFLRPNQMWWSSVSQLQLWIKLWSWQETILFMQEKTLMTNFIQCKLIFNRKLWFLCAPFTVPNLHFML